MTGRTCRAAALGVTLLVVAVAPGAGGAAATAGGRTRPPATVTELVGPSGEPLRGSLSINAAGQVAGTEEVTDGDILLETTPVRWERGRAIRLVPAGVSGFAEDLSEDGDVAITQFVPGPAMRPSLWRRGQWAPLIERFALEGASDVDGHGRVLGPGFGHTAGWHPTVWRRGAAPIVAPDEMAGADEMNDDGLAAGYIRTAEGRERPAVWAVGGAVTDLGTLGGDEGEAQAVNEAGDVAGHAETAAGTTHAFLWRDGVMTDLGTLGGDWSSPRGHVGPPLHSQTRSRTALNERGDVVGTSTTASGEEHAFLWADGEMTDLGTLGGPTSQAIAVNERREVVGVSDTASGEQHAFAWRDGVMTDLGALAGPAASTAVDVNDRGQVVGFVESDDPSYPRSVLWTLRR